MSRREEERTPGGEPDRLFELGLGTYCADCPARPNCGAERTEHACFGSWSDPGRGGEHVLHPDRTDVAAHVEKMRGFDFAAYEAEAIVVPELPSYVPQVRRRSALRGYLTDEIYGLRAKEIIGGQRVKTAEETRAFLDLRSDQKLAALLFDKDPLIERLYERPQLINELAEAGFDLITTASYSVWSPRPRIHQLYNLTRSLALCVALQRAGAPAVPRLDWVIDQDVERWARWLDANPCVQLVSIDAMTYKSNGWEQLTAGIGTLERLTDHRLRYLINGPQADWRWHELYGLIAPERLTLTDARLMAAPPTPEEQLRFPGPFAESCGPRFRQRVARRVSALAAAAQRTRSAALLARPSRS